MNLGTIAAHLANFIHQSLNERFHNLRIILWSDSQILLYWLQDRKPLKKFIQNRVNEINQLYPTQTWHYCPTSDNPADLLTRGITAAQLRASTLWQHGPAWLTAENLWPKWAPTEADIYSAQALATAISTPTDDESSQSETRDQPGIHHLIHVSKHTRLTGEYEIVP